MKKQISEKTGGKRAAVLIMGLAVLFCLQGCALREQAPAGEDMTEMAQKGEIKTLETGTGFGDETKELTVYFMDVGQGNGVLAECGGHYMLIDGGDEDRTSYVTGYLKDLGVTRLDYVVASHYDGDHLNGVVAALQTFDCDLVLSADYEADTAVYEAYTSVMDQKQLREIHPHTGETYRLGEASFTIVCPDRYDHELENDNSIGLRLVLGDNSFLICGDASKESERQMLRSGETLKSDVYMASHHGSKSSTSWNFLKAADPQAVVISAGYGNPFGHPSKTVMRRIRRIGADLYRTDLQGDLIAVSDGKRITWNVNPVKDYRDGSRSLAA